jgi:hypothetical protein
LPASIKPNLKNIKIQPNQPPMSEDFCPKLWAKYQQLRNKKIAFDRAAQSKPTGEALAEIKLIGREVYEFYGLFSDQGMDLFLESVEKYEDPIEKTKLIADFVPVLATYLNETQWSEFWEKIREFKEKELISNDDLNYLFLQKTFYQKDNMKSFKRFFLTHKSSCNQNEFTRKKYPFDPARLISQFARRIKDFPARDDKSSYIQWLKTYFELDNHIADDFPRLKYLKYILKKVALDQHDPKENHISNENWTDFIKELEEFNFSELSKEGLNYMQAFFVNTLHNLKTNQEIYIKSFIKFMIFLYKKFQEINDQLDQMDPNPQPEKEAYFFLSKLYELTLALKEDHPASQRSPFQALTIQHLPDNNFNLPNIDTESIYDFLLSHQKKDREQIKKLTPKDNSNHSNPALIVDLMEFDKINQGKFKRYKNAA